MFWMGPTANNLYCYTYSICLFCRGGLRVVTLTAAPKAGLRSSRTAELKGNIWLGESTEYILRVTSLERWLTQRGKRADLYLKITTVAQKQ